MKIISLVAVVLLSFATVSFAAPTLPLPKHLIAFDSAKGIALLQNSHNKTAFYKLMPYFTTEKGLAYCGVASSVMVLNALNIEPPLTPSHAPYRIFNQANYFTGKVLKVITPAHVGFHGMTLDQVAAGLRTFGVNVKRYYAKDVALNTFRQSAMSAVNNPQRFIIINFCRKDIHEKGCGHFSTLAAFNKKADRFLLLDVARYKYPPVWIKAAALYHSMHTDTHLKKGQSRGYLIVSRA